MEGNFHPKDKVNKGTFSISTIFQRSQLVEVGANFIAETEKKNIVEAFHMVSATKIEAKKLYGNGNIARNIATILTR